MSAFLVQNKTINVIISALSDYSEDNHFWLDKATKFGFDVISLHWQEKFANDLFELNCEALRQRYHDTTFPPFNYQPARAPSLVEVYKALQCFLYQCSEENVPETKLFKFMEEFSHSLANHIISNLPAYEKAEWN